MPCRCPRALRCSFRATHSPCWGDNACHAALASPQSRLSFSAPRARWALSAPALLKLFWRSSPCRFPCSLPPDHSPPPRLDCAFTSPAKATTAQPRTRCSAPQALATLPGFFVCGMHARMSAQKPSRAYARGEIKKLRRMKQPLVLKLESSGAPRNPVATALAQRSLSSAAGKHIRSQGGMDAA